MEKNRLLLVTLMLVVVLTMPSVFSATLRVPSQYASLQLAIDASHSGDTILVADGTFSGPDNRNLIFSELTIASENGRENCIIDCQSSGHGFSLDMGSNWTPTIDGFTIRHGSEGGIDIANTDPLIMNCRICFNAGPIVGGGIWCDDHSNLGRYRLRCPRGNRENARASGQSRGFPTSSRHARSR